MSKSITRKGLFERGPSASSGTIGVSSGGTGITSYAVGDLIYASGATTLSKLPIGTANQQLRVNAGATALEYFTPASSGITPGTTVVNSPTVTGSILMDIGGTVTESISYRAQQATPFSTAFGFESHSSGSFSGIYNSSFGYQSGKYITTGASNSFFGSLSGASIATGNGNTGFGRLATCGTASDSYNTCIGYYTMNGNSGSYNVALGYEAMYGGSNSHSISIGYRASGNHSSTILIGRFTGYSNTTATHQGILGTYDANGYIDNWYFNGVKHTSAYSVTLNASGGSGTNNAGASLTLAGGKSTGSAAGGSLVFQTSTTLGSGTTAQSLVTRLTLSGGAVTTDASTATWADALDFVFGSTTGTKIGTATTQKIGFWNATPVVQQVLATGASATVDDVITLLQTLGLCKQS